MSGKKNEEKQKLNGVVKLGEFSFNLQKRELFCSSGSTVKLRRQSLEVLEFLLNSPNETVSKTEIHNAVWGDTFVTDDSLVKCISEIRNALQDTSKSLLQTIARRGYKLCISEDDIDREIKPQEILPKRNIYVFDFVNLLSAEDTDYFAQGIKEDLLSRLSLLRGISIFSGHPNEHGEAPDFINQSQEFDFDLRGSARKQGDQVRINATLSDAKDSSVVFAVRYDRTIQNIFEIQDDIVDNIVSEMRVSLTDGDVAKAKFRKTSSVDAWMSFHRGWAEHLKYTQTSNAAARQYYAEAIEVDPDYFDAFVADGWAQWMEHKSSLVEDPDAALISTRNYVDGLLKRFPNSGDLLNLDATLLVHERHYEQANERANEALALPQSLMYGHATSAWVFLYSGEVERALEIFKKQVDTNRFVPDDTLHYYAHCLELLGQRDQAIALAKDYRKRVPSTVYGFTLLATALGRGGYFNEAQETVKKLILEHPNFNLRKFRRHEPYRDKSTLTEIVRLLSKLGIPE